MHSRGQNHLENEQKKNAIPGGFIHTSMLGAEEVWEALQVRGHASKPEGVATRLSI